jgi:hypothetical protein
MWIERLATHWAGREEKLGKSCVPARLASARGWSRRQGSRSTGLVLFAGKLGFIGARPLQKLVSFELWAYCESSVALNYQGMQYVAFIAISDGGSTASVARWRAHVVYPKNRPRMPGGSGGGRVQAFNLVAIISKYAIDLSLVSSSTEST